MTRRCFVFTCSLALAALGGAATTALAATSATDPALLALAPANATVLMGINVDQAKMSRFGLYMLGQIQFNDPGFQKFVNDTGFDPRRDLSQILSAAWGDATTQTKTLILGRGSFNAGKIANTSQAEGASIVNYNGVDLIVHGGTDMTGAIAFLNATTAVMGDLDAVKAAVDRRTSTVSALPADTLKTIQTLAAANDAWFLSTVSPATFFSSKINNQQIGPVVEAGMMQSVLAGSGGLKFSPAGATISGQAVARSDKDAQALADVFRFLINIVQSNRGSNPQLNQFAVMLDSAQISSQGSTMNLSLTIPEATLEQLFMVKKPGSHKQRPAASTIGAVR